MTHVTLSVIREEHAALAAMLRSMAMLMAEHRRHGTLPDFGVLRAMLFYVDEFPEKRHHPKEGELLFPKLRERSPAAAAVIDRLDAEHERGHHAIRELEHELLAFEVMGESRRDAFERALDDYIEFYLDHMALEESEVLPLAQRVLDDADWAELDEAFSTNRDPLTGHPPSDEFRPLFTRILNTVPSPIGMGPPLA